MGYFIKIQAGIDIRGLHSNGKNKTDSITFRKQKLTLFHVIGRNSPGRGGQRSGEGTDTEFTLISTDEGEDKKMLANEQQEQEELI